MTKSKFCHAIIQARMSSKRLPSKVLKILGGKTALEQVIDRLSRCKYLDHIIVATSDDPSDNPIEKLCHQIDVPLVRSSLNDVLKRMRYASDLYPSHSVLRITADCPLLSPKLIDEMILLKKTKTELDAICNFLPRTFPRGLDAEIINRNLLISLDNSSHLTSDQREHVTSVLYQDISPQNDYTHSTVNYKKNIYLDNKWISLNIASRVNSKNQSSIRLTLDTKEDYVFINKLFNDISDHNDYISIDQVLGYIKKNPQILKINSHIKQKS